MSRLIDMIMRDIGVENIPPRSKLAAINRRRGVSRSADFRRIEKLPRRVWDADAEELEEVRQGLTDMLRAKGGTFNLFTIQAAALRDIHDNKGAFLPISVGGGKALISLLAAVVLNAKRPVLFVPAALREQTNRQVIPQMKHQFKLHPRLRIVGNSELSLEKNNRMLDKLRPDLIILDECHEYKNKGAGRTKRMSRYLAEYPDTVVVAMSGTPCNRSVKDYAHIIRWCLGDRYTPLPLKWQELSDWADALDEGVQDQNRMDPGALMDFCRPGENARQGFRRRLTETPGVVASGANELGVSLRIDRIKYKIPSRVWRMLSDLRINWEDPNGDTFAEASAIWRVARQLALGFWYKWDPPGPPDWLSARREWKRYVRNTLKNNRRQLDTELQVWNEAEAAGTCEEWLEWSAIKDTFTPNPVPQWVDTFIVGEVDRWLSKAPGIVWVEHTAVGEKLSKELKIPYFGAGKKASVEILDASGPIVASIRAHGQGKNLQHQWHRNLVTSPPSSGKTWEQLLGRTHRHGQSEDTVTVDVFLQAEEQVSSMLQAQADARFLEDSLGGRQKLNYADFAFDL